MDTPRKPGYWETLTQKTQSAPQQAPAGQLPPVPEFKQRRTYVLVVRTVRWAGIGLALLALLGLWLNISGQLTGVLLGDMSLVRPTAEDRLNTQLALEQRKADYCALIDPQAAVVRPLAREGRQAAYFQSECYFNAAIALRDDLACASVRPLISAWWDGTGVSPENCASLVRAPRHREPAGMAAGAAQGLGKAGSSISSGDPMHADGTPIQPSAYSGTTAQAADDGRDPEALRAQQAAVQSHDGQQDDEQQKLQDAWENWKRSRRIEGR